MHLTGKLSFRIRHFTINRKSNFLGVCLSWYFLLRWCHSESTSGERVGKLPVCCYSFFALPLKSPFYFFDDFPFPSTVLLFSLSHLVFWLPRFRWLGITAKHFLKDECKAVPLQARRGPQCSRKLKFPCLVTTAQDGGKFVSLRHRPPLPPGNAPGTHFC